MVVLIDDPSALATAHRGWAGHGVRVIPLPNLLTRAQADAMTHVNARYPGPRLPTGILRLWPVAAALAFGAWIEWPTLHEDPWSSVVYWAVGVTLVLSGVLFAAEPAQRGTARLFVATGFAWLLNDLGVREYGVLPAIGWLSKPVDELLLMVIILRYPYPRITDPLIRRILAATIAVVVALHLASGLTWRPVWGGWPSTFWWPTVLPLRGAQPYIFRAYDIAGLVAAVIAVALVVRRFRRASGLERRELVPVLVSVAALGINIIVIEGVIFATGQEDVDDALSILKSVLSLTIPLAFVAAALRRSLDRAAVADLVIGVSQPATTESVRDALRRALADPGLDLFVWSPDRQAYVNADGSTGDPLVDQRMRRDVDDAAGRPLAVVLTDPALRRRPDLLDAAIRAATLGLENARLHADLLAQLDELQQSRTRIVEAGIEQRRQVERDLHDGAQQRLLALAATIGRAHTAAADPTMRELMDQARTELRRALKDLRDLARGIHPAVLEQVGLAAAVEAVSETLPLSVQIHITAQRLPPTVEATAYFVICEGLVNATKHANATRAWVTAENHDATLSVTVEDDGTGGATASPGGGLAGLSDRITALGGRLTIHSPTDAGTRLTAELPCA
jgi:signal transduction histidine kinase